MNTEEKAKRYDEAVNKLRRFMEQGIDPLITRADVQDFFPELRESEDERIRKVLIDYFNRYKEQEECGIKTFFGIPTDNILAWLEKQCKESSWKPSKEEMDVLYGLAYITNQYDERKEEVITRLYQDLKREFFNGSSYENIFPTNTSMEEDVRRRSTIQVLEYARSLDTYNQYGKADIDKNIAWLEKKKNIDVLDKEEREFAYNVDSYRKEIDEFYKGYNVGKEAEKQYWLKKQSEQKSVSKEYTFKSIPRLLDMIEPTDRAKAYCQKLIDTLAKEEYNTDAKIVEEVLKGWNGEDVPMAVMEDQRSAWSEEDIKEALRTEYEKGRADTIAEMGKEWSEEDKLNLKQAIYVCHQHGYTGVENWLKSIKQRIGG